MLQTVLLALVVGAGVSLLANVATTVYLHRALSHRALTLHPAGRPGVPLRRSG